MPTLRDHSMSVRVGALTPMHIPSRHGTMPSVPTSCPARCTVMPRRCVALHFLASALMTTLCRRASRIVALLRRSSALLRYSAAPSLPSFSAPADAMPSPRPAAPRPPMPCRRRAHQRRRSFAVAAPCESVALICNAHARLSSAVAAICSSPRPAVRYLLAPPSTPEPSRSYAFSACRCRRKSSRGLSRFAVSLLCRPCRKQCETSPSRRTASYAAAE